MAGKFCKESEEGRACLWLQCFSLLFDALGERKIVKQIHWVPVIRVIQLLKFHV